MHPYRQAGMLLPSCSVPCSWALRCPLFLGTVAGTGCAPGCCLHSMDTHTFIFLLPSCTHSFSHGHPSFLLFHSSLLAHLFAHSHPNTFIHSNSHSPSSARRCSHSQETRQPCWCWGLRAFPSRHHCGPSLGPAASSGIRRRGGREVGYNRN